MVTKTSWRTGLKRECRGSSSTRICNERKRALGGSPEYAKSLGQEIRDVGERCKNKSKSFRGLCSSAPQDWQQDSGQARSLFSRVRP